MALKSYFLRGTLRTIPPPGYHDGDAVLPFPILPIATLDKLLRKILAVRMTQSPLAAALD